MKSLNIDDFLDKANEFSTKLDEFFDLSNDLDPHTKYEQLRNLWRKTQIPYKMIDSDPLTVNYKNQVLDIYWKLTDNPYQTANKLSSDKLDSHNFKIGFPWFTHSYGSTALELAKQVQTMQALERFHPKSRDLIEFGVGWGNLAYSLSKLGKNLTVVDIDKGFLDRLDEITKNNNLVIRLLLGDFNDAVISDNHKYDCVIFNSSFHHCLDFCNLISNIRDRILRDDGVIIFISEPIFDNYPFPWGLRFDGESLCAIMKNKWLELGFDKKFLFHFMMQNGFFMITIPEIPNFIGDGYAFIKTEKKVNIEDIWLPEEFEQTFAPRNLHYGEGRYISDFTKLPTLKHALGSKYIIEITNVFNQDMKLSCSNKLETIDIILSPNQVETIHISAAFSDVIIKCDTFCPDICFNNGDPRLLGALLRSLQIV